VLHEFFVYISTPAPWQDAHSVFKHQSVRKQKTKRKMKEADHDELL
jgi:hypothetical protein